MSEKAAEKGGQISGRSLGAFGAPFRFIIVCVLSAVKPPRRAAEHRFRANNESCFVFPRAQNNTLPAAAREQSRQEGRHSLSLVWPAPKLSSEAPESRTVGSSLQASLQASLQTGKLKATMTNVFSGQNGVCH